MEDNGENQVEWNKRTGRLVTRDAGDYWDERDDRDHGDHHGDGIANCGEISNGVISSCEISSGEIIRDCKYN